jgi:propionyl-CoA synthetase
MAEANKLDWFRNPSVGLDSSNAPFFKWFSDGKINMCYNAVDRHVKNGKCGRWITSRFC